MKIKNRNNKRRTHESGKDVPGADALQGVYRRGLQDEQGQVCQSSHAEPLELLLGWLGNEGGDVIGLFLILCLGAAVVVAIAWVFVQILLWIEE